MVTTNVPNDTDLVFKPLPAKLSISLGPAKVTDDGPRGDHCPLRRGSSAWIAGTVGPAQTKAGWTGVCAMITAYEARTTASDKRASLSGQRRARERVVGVRSSVIL